ncbi:hypothetical protein DFJ77DRAFT_508983 [Powellomyces hirtus]|nr:hypothetical protein DFJ77DRAFT_508983 [Powellomyces hirtus]
MGQLAYDLPPPKTNINSTLPNAYGQSSATPHFPRPVSMSGRTPQVETALSLFRTFTPHQTKQFFDIMLAQMSMSGKEALIRVVYSSLGQPSSSDGSTYTASPSHPLSGQWTEDDILNGFASNSSGRTEELIANMRRLMSSASSPATSHTRPQFGSVRSAPSNDFDDDEEEGMGNTLIAAGREMHNRLLAAREIEDEVYRALVQAVSGSP